MDGCTICHKELKVPADFNWFYPPNIEKPWKVCPSCMSSLQKFGEGQDEQVLSSIEAFMDGFVTHQGVPCQVCAKELSQSKLCQYTFGIGGKLSGRTFWLCSDCLVELKNYIQSVHDVKFQAWARKVEVLMAESTDLTVGETNAKTRG